ncbi:MAG: restriction endonuclease [bacterium]|nr:restriction endonuclease [bacterium]
MTPGPPISIDTELEAVANYLTSARKAQDRLARVLRQSFDQIYDGQHTGRYRWDQLRKTEKTHFGSVFEINLQREFRFDDGDRMDFKITDIDVDCKYSQSAGRWMIPPEAHNELCLLVTADENTSRWSAGVVRCEADLLGRPNRDMKRSLTAAGRQKIRWLWSQVGFPSNALLHLDPDLLETLFVSLSGPRKGQQRINELFRKARGVPIGRSAVATVAQQVDYMKRVRGNGGARSYLREEGIVILGDYTSHQSLARQLGLPIPSEGEFVSSGLIAATEGQSRTASIDGSWWRVAHPDDPSTVPAPLLPRQ